MGNRKASPRGLVGRTTAGYKVYKVPRDRWQMASCCLAEQGFGNQKLRLKGRKHLGVEFSSWSAGVQTRGGTFGAIPAGKTGFYLRRILGIPSRQGLPRKAFLASRRFQDRPFVDHIPIHTHRTHISAWRLLSVLIGFKNTFDSPAREQPYHGTNKATLQAPFAWDSVGTGMTRFHKTRCLHDSRGVVAEDPRLVWRCHNPCSLGAV